MSWHGLELGVVFTSGMATMYALSRGQKRIAFAIYAITPLVAVLMEKFLQ